MNKLDKYLNIFIKKQDEIQKFMRVSALLNFDMETLCPSDAMNDHAKLIAHIDGCYMSIIKDKNFIKVYEYLYKHLKEIPNSGASYYYRKAIKEYHLTYCKVKDLSLDELGRQNLALSEAKF